MTRRHRALLAIVALLTFAPAGFALAAATTAPRPAAATALDDQASVYAACVARLADPRPLTTAQRTWLRTCRDALAPPAVPTPTATATPPPTPTFTPSPTTPAPTPTPTATTAGCALPAYPNPSCTGVPAGTALADVWPNNTDHDAYVVTTPGAVLDAKHIHGHLLIRAANVVIRNSWIEGNVDNDDTAFHHYDITDSTITNTPGVNRYNCNVSPALMWANYIATRVKVLGHDDGFRYTDGGPVVIRDSFARMCWADASITPPDGSHSGGIQAQCAVPCGSLTLEHNTFDNDQRDPVTGELLSNSGISVQSFTGNVVAGPVRIVDNLVMGGGYTMILWWYQGGSPYVVAGNRVVEGEWAYGPADARSSCAQQTWSGNARVRLDAESDTGYHVVSVVAPLDCID